MLPTAIAAAAAVPLPASDRWTHYEALARLEVWDAFSDEAHAFLAYRETSLTGGGWRVHVASALTAGGVFEPVAMAQQAQAAAARGERSFVWGYRLLPCEADPRHIEFRLHVADGRPVRLELYVRLRRADGSAAGSCSVVCHWPVTGALALP